MTQVHNVITCPRCASQTQTMAVGPLEIDRCPACGGIWFDVGEIKQLRGLADDTALRDDITQLLGDTGVTGATLGGAPLQCPLCALRMTRRHHEDAPGVVIDRCQTHGTWLDRGEVARLLRLASEVEAARARELADLRRPKQSGWFSAILDLFD